jgi:hypothetical protein
MLRETTQFQRFDVGQRFGRFQARDIGNGCMGPNIQNDLIAREHAYDPLVCPHLDGLWGYEEPFTHDQLGAARFVQIEVEANTGIVISYQKRSHPLRRQQR